MGTADFAYDVFLSHSSKDKAVVHEIAEHLKSDGLRVWLDDWEIRVGDNIPARTEMGLESSRLLILCMSANAFGSDWVALESQIYRFRDPLNKDRRFIPLRLDDSPLKGALALFSYLDWRPANRDHQLPKLLETCRVGRERAAAHPDAPSLKSVALPRGHSDWVRTIAFSPNGRLALSGSSDNTIRLWDVQGGSCSRVLLGHSGAVRSIAWSPVDDLALSGSDDHNLALWEVATGTCRHVLSGHAARVYSVAWAPDGRRALSSAADGTIRLWDVLTGKCLRVFQGQSGVRTAMWLRPRTGLAHSLSISGSDDGAVRLWDIDSGRCMRVLNGHSGPVNCLAWSTERRQAITGGADGKLRFWDVDEGLCLRAADGRCGAIYSVAWSGDTRFALTGGADGTLRYWDVESARYLRILEGHTQTVMAVALNPGRRLALTGSADNTLRLWDIDAGQCLRVFEGEPTPAASWTTHLQVASAAAGGILTQLPNRKGARHDTPPVPMRAYVAPENRETGSLQYTNAKVLLVGESGAGKTGLSMRLARDSWTETDSTSGAWATQWKLPVAASGGVDREIWLWDFGGQADQRLIHQLYMDETALAIFVFDPQREDALDKLGQWDRDLARAARRPFRKLLVAGRVDAGGVRISHAQIEAFAKERGFAQYIETSAKTGAGCPTLWEAIVNGIQWEDIPWRSSPKLFKQLKEEIIRLKDDGRVLLRLNELRETLQLKLAGQGEHFTDEELKAVVGLLAGPGVVWELSFGSWVLLMPERINTYAQAVIRTMRSDERQLGRIREEAVLRGELQYSAMRRLPEDEERIVLLAMHQTLVERGLCLRIHDLDGKTPTLLVFPAYYGRERPDLVGHPAVFVSYRFNGFLDDIYATLVVRLHHTQPFEQDELWRYAADFKTALGRRLGVKLTRRAEGAGELEVYFDPAVSLEDKVIFSKYVHEHLLQKGQDVERFRHYVCPHCETPVGNREVAMKRLAQGKPDILCVSCEARVPLWDDLEQRFASPETQSRVSKLHEQARKVLTTESRKRALVGDIISAVALAGQVSRELSTREHGIDMEIEFKTTEGELSGKKIYLRLDSDGAEHLPAWSKMPGTVLLVARQEDGEIRWMTGAGSWETAERFDVMSVRRWRDRTLESGIAFTGG